MQSRVPRPATIPSSSHPSLSSHPSHIKLAPSISYSSAYQAQNQNQPRLTYTSVAHSSYRQYENARTPKGGGGGDRLHHSEIVDDDEEEEEPSRGMQGMSLRSQSSFVPAEDVEEYEVHAPSSRVSLPASRVGVTPGSYYSTSTATNKPSTYSKSSLAAVPSPHRPPSASSRPILSVPRSFDPTTAEDGFYEVADADDYDYPDYDEYGGEEEQSNTTAGGRNESVEVGGSGRGGRSLVSKPFVPSINTSQLSAASAAYAENLRKLAEFDERDRSNHQRTNRQPQRQQEQLETEMYRDRNRDERQTEKERERNRERETATDRLRESKRDENASWSPDDEYESPPSRQHQQHQSRQQSTAQSLRNNPHAWEEAAASISPRPTSRPGSSHSNQPSLSTHLQPRQPTNVQNRPPSSSNSQQLRTNSYTNDDHYDHSDAIESVPISSSRSPLPPSSSSSHLPLPSSSSLRPSHPAGLPSVPADSWVRDPIRSLDHEDAISAWKPGRKPVIGNRESERNTASRIGLGSGGGWKERELLSSQSNESSHPLPSDRPAGLPPSTSNRLDIDTHRGRKSIPSSSLFVDGERAGLSSVETIESLDRTRKRSSTLQKYRTEDHVEELLKGQEGDGEAEGRERENGGRGEEEERDANAIVQAHTAKLRIDQQQKHRPTDPLTHRYMPDGSISHHFQSKEIEGQGQRGGKARVDPAAFMHAAGANSGNYSPRSLRRQQQQQSLSTPPVSSSSSVPLSSHDSSFSTPPPSSSSSSSSSSTILAAGTPTSRALHHRFSHTPIFSPPSPTSYRPAKKLVPSYSAYVSAPPKATGVKTEIEYESDRAGIASRRRGKEEEEEEVEEGGGRIRQGKGNGSNGSERNQRSRNPILQQEEEWKELEKEGKRTARKGVQGVGMAAIGSSPAPYWTQSEEEINSQPLPSSRSHSHSHSQSQQRVDSVGPNLWQMYRGNEEGEEGRTNERQAQIESERREKGERREGQEIDEEEEEERERMEHKYNHPDNNHNQHYNSHLSSSKNGIRSKPVSSNSYSTPPHASSSSSSVTTPSAPPSAPSSAPSHSHSHSQSSTTVRPSTIASSSGKKMVPSYSHPSTDLWMSEADVNAQIEQQRLRIQEEQQHQQYRMNKQSSHSRSRPGLQHQEKYESDSFNYMNYDDGSRPSARGQRNDVAYEREQARLEYEKQLQTLRNQQMEKNEAARYEARERYNRQTSLW